MPTNLNHVKDAVFARILKRLFTASASGEFALKGGFAMRAAANVDRHTKDIDLMAPPAVPLARVQSRIRDCMKDLKRANILEDMTFSEPKQTETTQRWKIDGTHQGQRVNVTVEVSRRNALPTGHIINVLWLAPNLGNNLAVNVQCLSLEALAVTKVACLASATREAPRDVWDLYALINLGVRPAPDLMAKFQKSKLCELKHILWGKLEKMNYQQAYAELSPFLGRGPLSRFDEEQWNDMLLAVGAHVEEWIDDHLSLQRDQSKNYKHPKP